MRRQGAPQNRISLGSTDVELESTKVVLSTFTFPFHYLCQPRSMNVCFVSSPRQRVHPSTSRQCNRSCEHEQSSIKSTLAIPLERCRKERTEWPPAAHPYPYSHPKNDLYNSTPTPNPSPAITATATPNRLPPLPVTPTRPASPFFDAEADALAEAPDPDACAPVAVAAAVLTV